MPYVLDESSYRTADNTFYTEDEARSVAHQAAEQLGRPVTVYELAAQELHFAFRVMPDGTVDTTDPLPEHQAIEPSSPAAIGRVATAATKPSGRQSFFDTVAEALEQAGRYDLAAAIDEESDASAGAEDGIRWMVDRLKSHDDRV